MRSIFLALALTMGISQTTCTAENSAASGPRTEPLIETPPKRVGSMKIKIKVGDKTVTATLIDSKTTRDFVSLLPLTLTMNDLFKREKFAHLPRAISDEGQRTRTYEVGEMVYWSPGPDVAIFYRHDGQDIPSPGIIVIGKIDSGVEAFNAPGSVRATIELDQTSVQIQDRVVRLAELEIDPAQLENYKAALKEEIEASIRLEPGVLTIYAVSVKGNPAQIRIFEMYADADAYNAHLESPHFRKYKTGTQQMVKSLKLVETDPFVLGAKAK